VAVLLSGGVDSSVALNLVAASGHAVTAFYLQIWFQEDFRNFWDACPWEEDLAYARAVCDQARVKLVVIPLTKDYWERVVAHSLNEIKAGRTPNPDVLCNSRIKFGAFLEHIGTKYGGAFDRVASGHYARIHRHNGSGGGSASQAALPAPLLCLSEDGAKDQTYFLAGLSTAQLRAAMFPLGGCAPPADSAHMPACTHIFTPFSLSHPPNTHAGCPSPRCARLL
jgi:tRNA U34 2-thiouridine synthase MnmA/TrmU